MIDQTFIFPPEQDLPGDFITWARGDHSGITMQLRFLEGHTDVVIKGDCFTAFNICAFELGQRYNSIMEIKK